MKLSLSPHPKDPAGKRARTGRIELARAQLRQAVHGVLTQGLEVLGDRLQLGPGASASRQTSALRQLGVAAQVHGLRLREVIERDRALIASNPEPGPVSHEATLASQATVVVAAPPAAPSAAPPAANVAGLELLSEPFVASAAAVAPPAPTLCDEPIRTRTMAKLLAAQGHRQRALSIYDYLLSKSSDDSLRGEADAVRASEAGATATVQDALQ